MTPYFRITVAVLAIIAGSMLAYAVSAAVGPIAENKWQLVVGNTIVNDGGHDTFQQCDEARIDKGVELGLSRTSGQLWLKCQKPYRYTFVADQQQPVDCVVQWPEWPAECPASGVKVRTGIVITQPANGGAACPSLTETQDCTPPASSTWAQCANENERCGFTGQRRVRYGAGSVWTEPRYFIDGVNCSNDVFGDPVPLVVKSCEIETTEQPAPGPSSELLSWVPPTQNTDGSPLTDLVGYAIYVSQDLSSLGTGGTFVAVPSATSYRVEGLTPGTWYFAIAAVATDDRRSALSNIIQKFVQ